MMEYCDMTLQNWLCDTSSNVTVDVLESMLVFILNIAKGVSHLHANEVCVVGGTSLNLYKKYLNGVHIIATTQNCADQGTDLGVNQGADQVADQGADQAWIKARI